MFPGSLSYTWRDAPKGLVGEDPGNEFFFMNFSVTNLQSQRTDLVREKGGVTSVIVLSGFLLNKFDMDVLNSGIFSTYNTGFNNELA